MSPRRPLLVLLVLATGLIPAATAQDGQAMTSRGILQPRLAIHEGADGEAYVTFEGEDHGERWPTIGIPRSGPVHLAVTNNGTTPHVFTIEGEPRPMTCDEPADQILAWNATTGPIAPGETKAVQFEVPTDGVFEILYRVDGGDRVGNLQPRDTLATQCARVLPIPGAPGVLATGALALAALVVTGRRRGSA